MPSQFRAKRLEAIVEELQSQTNQLRDDVESVRRTINQLQKDVEIKLRKETGIPIDRQDIIQTREWSGQSKNDFGYRINPFTVIARPFQPDLSEEL
jgi:predicted RNase H-like nuclease (RuvC/YqgF family)